MYVGFGTCCRACPPRNVERSEIDGVRLLDSRRRWPEKLGDLHNSMCENYIDNNIFVFEDSCMFFELMLMLLCACFVKITGQFRFVFF